jgi:hypothetical protein
MLIFWMIIMIFIWLFLLGWARIVSGRFFPTEVAMTLVIRSGFAVRTRKLHPLANERSSDRRLRTVRDVR